MTRAQFIALLTAPFIAKLLPKEKKKELPWSLKYAKMVYKSSKNKPMIDYSPYRSFVRKYPLTEKECFRKD